MGESAKAESAKADQEARNPADKAST